MSTLGGAAAASASRQCSADGRTARTPRATRPPLGWRVGCRVQTQGPRAEVQVLGRVARASPTTRNQPNIHGGLKPWPAPANRRPCSVGERRARVVAAWRGASFHLRLVIILTLPTYCTCTQAGWCGGTRGLRSATRC